MYLEFLLESLLGWMRNFEVLVLLFAEFNLFGIWRTLEKLFFGLLHPFYETIYCNTITQHIFVV